MRTLFRKLLELSSRLRPQPKLDTGFIFPYSTDAEKKRDEIWGNLQNGLLLEDRGFLLPWETPFNRMGSYAEERRDLGDRTLWGLGSCTILDGYQCRLEAMKWIDRSWNAPLTALEASIGTDAQGYANFRALCERFTDLLGEPTLVDLKKFGSLDLGVLSWTMGRARIALVGVEVFNCRYSLRIGRLSDSVE